MDPLLRQDETQNMMLLIRPVLKHEMFRCCTVYRWFTEMRRLLFKTPAF